MQRVLAIDTALESCSVSVANGDKTRTIHEPMGRGQTERLIPIIIDACKAVDLTLKDIEAVAVTRGPGSFTGVRVGLSVARTLSTIQDIPLYGMTTFEAVQALHNKPQGIVLSSKRDDVYFQKENEEPCLSTLVDIHEKYPELSLIGNVEGVEPVGLDKLTEAMITTVQSGDLEEGLCTPVYLRNADVSKSKKKYRSVENSVTDALE